MRRVTLVLSLIATLLCPAMAKAMPPERHTSTFDDEFPSFLSFICGFDVFVHLEGTVTATLFFDRNGALIREIDTQPRLKITFLAPSTGKSFTCPLSGAFVQDYTDGGAVGSPVIATATGVFDGTGSTAPDAGRLVFNGIVGAISPDGVPLIDLTSEISASGHFNDDLAAARCATLSDP